MDGYGGMDDGWIDGWWVNGWGDGQWMIRQMGGWMDVNGWTMDELCGRMDRYMDG